MDIFMILCIAIPHNSSGSHWKKIQYKTVTFWPKAKLCKCSGISARCHCLREILKFLWCETAEICSKAAKNKQTKTHLCFSASSDSVVVAVGYNQHFHGKSLEFFKTFSLYGKCVLEEGPEFILFGREDKGYGQVGCSGFIPSTLVNSKMMQRTVLGSLTLRRDKSLLSGSPASRKIDSPQNRKVCMESILYPWPLVIHSLSVNSANVEKKPHSHFCLFILFVYQPKRTIC